MLQLVHIRAGELRDQLLAHKQGSALCWHRRLMHYGSNDCFPACSHAAALAAVPQDESLELHDALLRMLLYKHFGHEARSCAVALRCACALLGLLLIIYQAVQQ